MATRYFARERFFTGLSPSLIQATVVFASDDLTADECQTLAQSVQKALDDLEDMRLADSWFFELSPSAEEDPVAFINLKSEWDRTKSEIEEYRGASGNSWQFDVYWLYSMACEHADIIRGLRNAEMPVVYLQCDSGHGFETFECVDCLTLDELDTLEALLNSDFYDMGMVLRVVSDWHAEREPALFIQAKQSWKRFEEAMKQDEADAARMAASGASYKFIEEIKGLRRKPVVYGPGEEDDDADGENSASSLAEDGPPTAVDAIRADASLRGGYRDSDNYWRNVWLYEQRKAGKTNSTILAELTLRASEFAPIDSENALRSAVDSIATYHHWPLLKGKSGRPRAKSRPNDGQT